MSPLFLDIFRLTAGIALLYFGAEWLVKGAAGLALALRVSPIVVGMTVVAYGTSAPEMTVSVAAALDGKSAVALGNVIGSNIANLGLILGLTALVSPPRAEASLIQREIPALVGAALLVPLTLIDGVVSRVEAAALLALALGFTLWMLRTSRGAEPATAEVAKEALAEAGAGPAAEQAAGKAGKARLVGLAVIGLVVLVGGGKIFVDGAVGIARAAGMSERVVGLTIVAIGTSLPELAASMVAALRGHSSIAVGNVVGSNIFNVLLILGAAGLVRPIEGSLATMRLDVVVLLVMTGLGAVFLRTERLVRRGEGAVLLVGYVAFLVALAR